MGRNIRRKRRKIKKNMEEGKNDERAKILQRKTVENIKKDENMKKLGKEYRKWEK